MRLWTGIVCACALVAATAGQGRAQVCGDATGDGTVTVTDGVQTLRAGAGLESSCTPAACDVDGNGSVTVTDGVLVLRVAASLPIEGDCSGEGVNAEVAQLVDDVAPFLVFGLRQSPGAEGVSAPAQDDTDDCPNGGTRERDTDALTITITLNDCGFSDPGLGNFEFDGTIEANLLEGAQADFDVTVTDLDSGRVVRFTGEIDGSPLPGGGVLVDGGLVLTTPQGDFELQFDELVIDDEGDPESGTATIEDTDDLFDLAALALEGDGSSAVDLTATFDDTSVQRYVLDTDTGELTRVE